MRILIEIAPLLPFELERVDRLLARMEAYSLAVNGTPTMTNGSAVFLRSLPPGKSARDKHVFVIREDGDDIGLIDLIADFPRNGCAFLGLLALADSCHRQGHGRDAYQLVETYAREQLQASTIRLAVVSTNNVRPFWQKMGFRETGEVRPYEGEAIRGKSILMEKPLS